jgi:hypothetical protein
MNIPDLSLENLISVYWVTKILNFFDVDPDRGSGILSTLVSSDARSTFPLWGLSLSSVGGELLFQV